MVQAAPEIDTGAAVEMEFEPFGRLIYGVLEGERWQIMLLIYRVEADVIVSNQPSAPHEERTRFVITENGNLMLDWLGQPAIFERILERSFELPAD